MTSSTQALNLSREVALQARVSQAARRLPPATQWKFYTSLLVIVDVVMMFGAFWLAYYVRFHIPIAFFYQEAADTEPFYLTLICLLTPLWLIVFTALGLYNRGNLLGGIDEYDRVFRATTTGLFIVIVAGFLKPETIARGWLLMAWGFAFLLTATGRFCIRRFVYACRKRGYFLSTAVIVGANAEGRSLSDQLNGWKTSGLCILGFIDDKTEVTLPLQNNFPVLGSIDQLDKVVDQYKVEELIIATSAISPENILSIFKRYGVKSNVNLRLSSGLYEVITTGLQVKELAYVPLVNVNKVRLAGVDRLLKLVLDYGLTIPFLLIFWPLFLLIALAVKLDSKGPVIHRRRVMGVNGVQFDAFKFRTMYVNGDEILDRYPDLKEEWIKNQKLKNDPRVTRVGKYLRKFSLDELPQLFNILRHEMSLVGPRMISPGEMKNYNQWGINLLTVRPGLTGLWQVSGRSDVSYEQRVRLDMEYIRNWSIWLDAHIILRTFPAMVKADGAY